MIFFSIGAAPDPTGLILTAAEVAAHKRRKRLAADRTSRLLARLRRDRDATS